MRSCIPVDRVYCTVYNMKLINSRGFDSYNHPVVRSTSPELSGGRRCLIDCTANFQSWCSLPD